MLDNLDRLLHQAMAEWRIPDLTMAVARPTSLTSTALSKQRAVLPS
jgi:hypothetical protein